MSGFDPDFDGALSDARAVLRGLDGSALAHIHLRTEAFELYISRSVGGLDPMSAPIPPSAAVEGAVEVEGVQIRAPHVGTVAWLLAEGEVVAPGAPVAELRVLEDVIAVAHDTAGVVTAHYAAVGDLAEFHTELLTVR